MIQAPKKRQSPWATANECTGPTIKTIYGRKASISITLQIQGGSAKRNLCHIRRRPYSMIYFCQDPKTSADQNLQNPKLRAALIMVSRLLAPNKRGQIGKLGCSLWPVDSCLCPFEQAAVAKAVAVTGDVVALALNNMHAGSWKWNSRRSKRGRKEVNQRSTRAQQGVQQDDFDPQKFADWGVSRLDRNVHKRLAVTRGQARGSQGRQKVLTAGSITMSSQGWVIRTQVHK